MNFQQWVTAPDWKDKAGEEERYRKRQKTKNISGLALIYSKVGELSVGGSGGWNLQAGACSGQLLL